MFIELRELLCSGAIRRHQLGGKRPFDPNIITYQFRECGSFDKNAWLLPELLSGSEESALPSYDRSEPAGSVVDMGAAHSHFF